VDAGRKIKNLPIAPFEMHVTSDIRLERDPRNTLRVLSSNCKRAIGLCRAKRSMLPVEVGLLVHLAFSAKFQLSHRSLTARKRTHGSLNAFGMRVTRA
jgi:hypothetical protein